MANNQKPAQEKNAVEIDTASSASFVITRELKLYTPPMQGDDVKAVQQALISMCLHSSDDTTHGTYREATALAVCFFQSMNGLKVTGKVDETTAVALGATWDAPKE
jgi:peptidoglycan hydrolase-like protein with peptidoglycan-binding domain